MSDPNQHFNCQICGILMPADYRICSACYEESLGQNNYRPYRDEPFGAYLDERDYDELEDEND